MTPKTTRFFAAVVLTAILSMSAFAGDMQTDITTPPPPSQATATTQTTSNTPEGSTTPTSNSSGTVAETALELAAGLLAAIGSSLHF